MDPARPSARTNLQLTQMLSRSRNRKPSGSVLDFPQEELARPSCCESRVLSAVLTIIVILVYSRHSIEEQCAGAMKISPQRDLFPGALEMMVLQTLRRGPLHGYALAQVIMRNSGDLLAIEEGSLYPALQRMLKAGWLAAEWGLSARNRRVRIYKTTSAGRKQLEGQVSSFDRMLEGIARVMQPAES
jgi:PadR family transcriptional regulator PadR